MRHHALEDADPQNLLVLHLPPGADIPCCGPIMESCRPDVGKLSALFQKLCVAAGLDVGIPRTARATGVLFCRLAVTSHLLLPLTAARALLHTQSLPCCPVGTSFSHLHAPLFCDALCWLVCSSSSVPQSQRLWSASDLLKYSSCMPTGSVVFMGFSLAFYSSVSKCSPHVLATANGALVFPHVPGALWFRVLGGWEKREREKLAKGDIGSLR